jgi:hypothetical protein
MLLLVVALPQLLRQAFLLALTHSRQLRQAQEMQTQ